jgi:hypothetical protein
MSQRGRHKPRTRGGPPGKQAPSSSLAYLNAYTTGAQVFGRTVRARELIDRIGTYSWIGGLRAIAQLSCRVMRHGANSETVRQETVDHLLGLTGTDTALLEHIRSVVGTYRDKITAAHEEALAFLAHTVIVYGGDGDDAPAPGELAMWLLCANDYLDHWAEQDARPLTKSEELIAEIAHVLRFNNDPDRFSIMARTHHLLSTQPHRGPLADPASWKALQAEAFGCDFREYFESLVAPLSLKSLSWGTDKGANAVPVVSRQNLLSQTRIAPDTVSRLLDSFGATREELRETVKARMREDGLPQAPTALYHHPLVQTDSDQFVAPIPWALDTQLRSGMWARLLGAAKRIYGDNAGPQIWNSTFGDAFEEWCRKMASAAFSTPKARGRLILPSSPGAEDEVEDVVIVDQTTAILFSAKSRFVAESVARHARSRTALIDWYDKFFFGDASGSYRVGAVRLLSRRIDRIRSGEFEATISRTTRLLPVLLTYDSLCEDVTLYRWIETRCRDLGLLQQWKVAPLTIARVDDFERLMSFSARGGRVVPFLRQRENSHWRHRRLDQMLAEMMPEDLPVRLPAVTEQFDEVLSGLGLRLFGKPLKVPAVAIGLP